VTNDDPNAPNTPFGSNALACAPRAKAPFRHLALSSPTRSPTDRGLPKQICS
jgi:hypothetical protein